jgi:hypothetical protein
LLDEHLPNEQNPHSGDTNSTHQQRVIAVAFQLLEGENEDDAQQRLHDNRQRQRFDTQIANEQP